MQKIETTIASLAKRAEQLAAKRAKAQEALEKAASARQQALLAGDLDDQRTLDKLQAAVDTAGSALTGIDGALAILAQQKAEADAQLTAERDCIERAAAADKLDSQVAAIEAALSPWLEQSRIFADALTEIAHAHFGADEMSKYVQSCMGQMETAANFHLGELKAMPQMIRDGRQAIPAEKWAPAPVAVPEQPRTQTVFLLRSVKYKDAAGKTVYATGLEDCEMPIEIAQRALRSGAAVTPSNPKRRELKGAKGGTHGDPSALNVTDLDAISDFSGAHYAGPNDPVLREANFVEIDRSAEARVIQIAAGRVA